jgi:hypothetical protein
VEALTDSDGKQANTISEKEEMLRQESFPQNEHNQYFEMPPAGHAHQSVAEEVVKEDLFAQSVGKARGPDRLSQGAVHLLWQWEKKRIVELAKAVIRSC